MAAGIDSMIPISRFQMLRDTDDYVYAQVLVYFYITTNLASLKSQGRLGEHNGSSREG